MSERFILPNDFPTTEQLKEETYNAIVANGGRATTSDIKNYIIDKLQLSEEVLNFENSDGISMLIDYRLRWTRTALKNEGKIQNETRGVWKTI